MQQYGGNDGVTSAMRHCLINKLLPIPLKFCKKNLYPILLYIYEAWDGMCFKPCLIAFKFIVVPIVRFNSVSFSIITIFSHTVHIIGKNRVWRLCTDRIDKVIILQSE